ncbi:hypothetical protein TAL182_PC00430 (plasmid) [Rhizobium sp. TAL182]|nr:hypothetical protein TAL182_PC00430 [Rhizobium sp. TAL182]
MIDGSRPLTNAVVRARRRTRQGSPSCRTCLPRGFRSNVRRRLPCNSWVTRTRPRVLAGISFATAAQKNDLVIFVVSEIAAGLVILPTRSFTGLPCRS